MVVLLAACAANQPAPVEDRAPVVKKAGPAAAGKTAAGNKTAPQNDWRPDVYTVKKGDTLFSIGLQYGYDYKDIAQVNNIAPPYTIYLGQQLKLKEADSQLAKSDASSSDGDVVITPLSSNNLAPASPAAASNTSPASLITSPKALREAYSEQALLAKPPPNKAADPAATAEKAVSAAADKPPADKPSAELGKADKPAVKAMDDGTIDWAWPTSGKVIAPFNESVSAKGIDIAGSMGQPVKAAASGKVIYSGADLRGYGKLVIVKHTKNYLSVYAHNSKILVKEGQAVSAGQKIAEMGNTDTDGVKLHFEIRQQGKSVDPAKYLPASQ